MKKTLLTITLIGAASMLPLTLQAQSANTGAGVGAGVGATTQGTSGGVGGN